MVGTLGAEPACPQAATDSARTWTNRIMEPVIKILLVNKGAHPRETWGASLRGLTMAAIFGEQCSGFKADALRRNTGGHKNQATSKAGTPSKLQVWIEVKA
jgi:hypothetical protein